MDKRLKQLEGELFLVLGLIFRLRVQAFLKRSLSDYSKVIATQHSVKLRNLGLFIDETPNKSAIFNMTALQLTEAETKLLSKGLQHSIFPHKLDELNLQAEFENLFSQIKPHIKLDCDKISLKTTLMNSYSDIISAFKFYKNTNYYFSREDGITIKNLKVKCTKQGILLIKADKGNTVVLLTRQQYLDRMNDILSDDTKFRKVSNDDTLDRQERLQGWCRRHRQILGKDYDDVYPTSASIPVLYGQPKIHKANAPLRPIMSMVGALNHGLAKWLSGFLQHIRTAPSMCRDSFTLSKYLSESDLHQCYFVSYDVVSLFTNIPLQETIDIILDKLYHDLDAKDLYNGIKRLDLKRALEWAVKDNTFLFNGQLYKQVDGVAMGSPLAPILADIFMNHLLEGVVHSRSADWENIVIPDTITLITHNLRFFVRYVDDTLVCFDSREEAFKFLKFLNSLHPNVKFTMDQECDFGRISFLDLWIMKEDNKLDILVYRKPTHSGVYTHFSSFVPFRNKRQLVVTLLERAYSICSDWALMHIEFEKLTAMFRKNGYNLPFLENIIRDFLNKKHSNKDITLGCKQRKVYITLPYLGEVSEQVKGAIYSCLSRIKCGSVQVVITYNFARVGGQFPYKDRQPKQLANGVVYKIECNDCDKFYIGETARASYKRFTEHCKRSGSGLTEVGKHLKANPTHNIDFDNSFSVLKYGLSYTWKRKFAETLFLQEHAADPNRLNDMQTSLQLYLFSV